LRRTPDDDDEHPQDVAGCLWSSVRIGCGLSFLYVTMFLAVLAVAILSLIFFR
jgi:hypothetical protein